MTKPVSPFWSQALKVISEPILFGDWEVRQAKAKDAAFHRWLIEYLDYDPGTGWMFWKKSPSRKVPIGKRAGHARRDKDGYVHIMINGRHYHMHRLVWFFMYGA
jgi:hypothetical protein